MNVRWILAAALLVRTAFAFLFLRHPLAAVVPQDTDAYWTLARAIAAGDFRHPAFAALSPLYAFVLAPLTGLAASTAHVAVAGLHVLLDTAAVALVYYVARETFGRRAALFAAGLYAAYGLAIYDTAVVLPVTLTIFLMTLVVAALVHVRDRPAAHAVLPGAALGLLALCRPNAIALLGVAILWMVWRDRTALRRAAALATGTLLVLLPFAARAAVNGLGFSAFPQNGGINFYIGNHPDANGMYVSVPGVSDLPLDQVTTSVDVAAQRTGRALDLRAASRYWWHEGLVFLRREPAAAARVTLLKLGLFFRAEEIPLNINYAFARPRLPLLRLTLGFGFLLPLAVAGLVALPGRSAPGHTEAVLLVAVAGAYAATVVAFFVSDRYRAPVVPIVAVLAGHGTAALGDAFRERRRAAVAGRGAAMALAAVLVNAPFAAFTYPEYAKDYFELGRVHRDRGDYAAALEHYGKAVALSPDVPEALVELATTYHLAGRPLEAERTLRRSLALDPQGVPARRNLALLYKEQGLFEEALPLAVDEAQRRAIVERREELERRTGDPAAFARAQYDLGVRLYGERRLADARYAFRRAVAAGPRQDDAWFALALVDKDLRLGDEACAAIERAAALAPSDAEYTAERGVLCPRR